DRYDIWINTTDPADLAFIEALGKHDKIRLIEQPDGEINGNSSINAFFRYAMEPDEVYIRFDDDIVWMKPDTIEKIVEFRLNNPDYFLVVPFIINNAICTSVLQAQGKLSDFRRVAPYCLDKNGWASEIFAEKLHRQAIKEINDNNISEFSGVDAQFAACRFSINCISWFGSDLKPFDQIYAGSDEVQISYAIPMLANRTNAIVADTLVSHFAFYTQREHLDATDILKCYYDLRGTSAWPSQDAIEFVEEAYASVSGSTDIHQQYSTSNSGKSFLQRKFPYPAGIKTKETSIAGLIGKAAKTVGKLNPRGK
ncbi:MAG: hypothetical protein AAF362_19100, partial [Pseudomonadota bacterium]